jgi:uncharacterized protein YjbI with pentapeptide repeats
MKLPHGRRAHEGAGPARRPRPAWLWMLAFRRQHYQEIAIVLSDLDATEPRITELYTKAVEQLGSDRAAVRLGGLYALERLAQDNPAHRQTIVDVICAYLRMPFSPAVPTRAVPTSKPEPEAADGQKEPGTEGETGTDGIGDTWQQERQVRLTAQSILADHLRDDRAKDQQSSDPPSSRFWKNIRLDLTGASLIDFNLVNGVMADANFHSAAFWGAASFDGATFSGDARFGEAAFSGDVSFGGATFSGAARFGEAAFSGAAQFDKATFSRAAWFDNATCSGDARFGEAIFSGDARFGEAAFSGVAWFRGAAFSGVAWFRRAAFSGGAGFGEAIFSGDAWFDQATFNGASFGGATFSGGAGFGEAIFSGDAWFDQATFSRGASFGETVFSGDVWFDQATFSHGASFGETVFSGDAGFGEATFSGAAWFGEAAFSGGADALHFEQARILSPGASHVWPTGWCLAYADGGGYTVVRANRGDGS